MQQEESTRIARSWPGKLLREKQHQEHPALWHMLDVGAVAQRLLEYRPIANTNTDQALALLVALHDVGKISNSFRSMLREGKYQQFRHWEHSAIILRRNQHLAKFLGGSEEVRNNLYEATAGHHGGPRTRPAAKFKKDQQWQEIGEAALADANAAICAITDLFPDASLEAIKEQQVASLSWQLNGLTVQSDWIGSNVDWFTSTGPDISIDDYWQGALQRATQAIAEANLHAVRPRQPSVGKLLPSGVHARPMQVAVQSCDLPDGPVLGLIEDSTGAGKTEASLILASRLMQADKADGLFFALPTMATANAMLSRIEAAAPHLFDGMPTLGLAHGRAHMSEQFQAIKGRDGSNPEDGPHCGKWLSDDRRRILLSDVGVGTIDQALFAVLPTRFNSLRLRALASKVLIVDEAHSYDPYMDAQLERLLTFQARMGGSAILMTATLPIQKRENFIKAFHKGLEAPTLKRGRRVTQAESISEQQPTYPALTICGESARLTAVEPAEPTVRQVAIHRVSDPADAVNLIADASVQGAACVWIRNAVDDAIKSVEALKNKGIQADLLHARFAICDRLSKEQDLQKLFGKDGKGREGKVLVATQVAEQSLDLDFDVMVSDLAPIGSLIQRAGRLWRHLDERPAKTRPVEGPILHILSPDPDKVDSDRWLHPVMEHGAWVYPPTVMWRSAKAIFDAGVICEPSGLRELIEQVESSGSLPVPEVLESMGYKHEGEKIADRQQARNCLIEVNRPFDQEAMRKVWDDEKFPTRLGVPQVTLALARHSEDGLVPYCPASGKDESPFFRWTMSELQVSWLRFKKLLPDIEQDSDMNASEIEEMLFPHDNDKIVGIKRDWPDSRARYTIIAPLGPDGQLCEGLCYDADLGAVWGYSTRKS